MKLSTFYDHLTEAAAQEGKSLDEICELAVSYGITAVEIDNTRLQKEPELVMQTLKKAGMTISCMYGFFDFGHENDCQKGRDVVDLACKFEIPRIMPIPGFLKKYEFLPGIYQNRVSRMVRAMREICTYAQGKNVKVVLEDFDGKAAPFATAKQLAFFMEQIPELLCAFDTGNFLFSEEDSYEVLPDFINRIGHVHCKDRTFTKTEGEKPLATVKGRDMYSCAVGRGCIRMKEIVEQILATGYDDFFAIEHFGSLHQLRDLRDSAAFLAQFGGICD